MRYITSTRTGLNDIKALVHLEDERKRQVLPLLNLRGNSSRHLDDFLVGWAEHDFFLDVSPYPGDSKSELVTALELSGTSGTYAARMEFLEKVHQRHDKIIPTVSWRGTPRTRDVIQFALALERMHQTIAIRIDISGQGDQSQASVLLNILDALSDHESTWVLLDFGVIRQSADLASSALLTQLLQRLRGLTLAGLSILTTSFPSNRPAPGSTRSVASLDFAAQNLINTADLATPLTYGDYAATNPEGSIAYIPGMQVIPFASYLTWGEWWQARRGADKEFSAYVPIAQDICSLPGFHGVDFCWANAEIDRIANGRGGTGNNGTWNGIRINQHICAMLDYLNTVGFPAIAPASGDDDEIDDF